jgi:hypothetical protein
MATSLFKELHITDRFKLPPHPGGTARALSRVGYDLAQALSDLVDNSIDAEAKHVSVVFHRDDKRIVAVTVADDGRGMDSQALESSMQFGVQINHDDHDLGTFGLGLKSASLSQCRTLTVISRQSGRVAACRWRAEAIKSDWSCERIDSDEAAERLDELAEGSIDVSRSGTLVSWERLDRLAVGEPDLDRFLSKQLDALDLHFGLHFHRFLSSKRLSIVLAARHVANGLGLPRLVAPYDPFLYRRSGDHSYPKTFVATLPELGELTMEAHIWPPDALDQQFKLGRKVPTYFQGFYFYRHDRLIQAGGWNDFRKDVADSELVLARVRVDLPKVFPTDAVNVQKTALQISASFSEALEHAKCGDLELNDYLEAARRVYRAASRKSPDNGDLPLIPGEGLPVALRHSLAKLLAEEDQLHRPVDFEWISLGSKTVFELDRTEDKIFLNRKFRAKILQGHRASSADAPLIKALIFLLLRHEFDRERQSSKRKQWIDECNAVLLRAIRFL